MAIVRRPRRRRLVLARNVVRQRTQSANRQDAERNRGRIALWWRALREYLRGARRANWDDVLTAAFRTGARPAWCVGIAPTADAPVHAHRLSPIPLRHYNSPIKSLMMFATPAPVVVGALYVAC